MEAGNTTKAAGKKKRWIVGFVALVVVVLIAVAVWPGPKEPEYQGKKLSEWLEMRTSHPRECEQAVKAIGTNAVPRLLMLVRYERPKWRAAVASNYLDLPGWVVNKNLAERIRYGTRERAADAAVFGFQCLGHDAAAAVPKLLVMLRDTNAPMTGCRALVCLADVGTAVVPTYEDVRPFFGSTVSPEVSQAIFVIRQKKIQAQ